jgi:mannose-1-phosphate guanylyltransferase
MMEVCDKLARSTDKYITGGFKPDFAVMGVDYLIKGEKVNDSEEVEVFKVDKFLWRGTKEDAQGYIKDGKALLHANHTCMTPRNLLKMYQKYKNEWYEPLLNYINGADLATEYAKMSKGPLEDVTRLAFEAGDALVVELPFKWVDFGTWESVAKYLGSDENNNFVKTNKYTAIIGLRDLVVVEADDALLICKKDQSGKVGEVVEKLKAAGKNGLV